MKRLKLTDEQFDFLHQRVSAARKTILDDTRGLTRLPSEEDRLKWLQDFEALFEAAKDSPNATGDLHETPEERETRLANAKRAAAVNRGELPTSAKPITVESVAFRCYKIGISRSEWRSDDKRLVVWQVYGRSAWLASANGEMLKSADRLGAKSFRTFSNAARAAIRQLRQQDAATWDRMLPGAKS